MKSSEQPASGLRIKPRTSTPPVTFYIYTAYLFIYLFVYLFPVLWFWGCVFLQIFSLLL